MTFDTWLRTNLSKQSHDRTNWSLLRCKNLYSVSLKKSNKTYAVCAFVLKSMLKSCLRLPDKTQSLAELIPLLPSSSKKVL